MISPWYLVGGIPTPLNNMTSLVGMIIPFPTFNRKSFRIPWFQSPPIRFLDHLPKFSTIFCFWNFRSSMCFWCIRIHFWTIPWLWTAGRKSSDFIQGLRILGVSMAESYQILVIHLNVKSGRSRRLKSQTEARTAKLHHPLDMIPLPPIVNSTINLTPQSRFFSSTNAVPQLKLWRDLVFHPWHHSSGGFLSSPAQGTTAPVTETSGEAVQNAPLGVRLSGVVMAVPFKCRLWFIYDVFFLWHRLEVMLEYSQTPWVKTVPFGVVSKVGHWNGSLPTIPRVDHHDSAQFSRRQFRRYFPNNLGKPGLKLQRF